MPRSIDLKKHYVVCEPPTKLNSLLRYCRVFGEQIITNKTADFGGVLFFFGRSCGGKFQQHVRFSVFPAVDASSPTVGKSSSAKGTEAWSNIS